MRRAAPAARPAVREHAGVPPAFLAGSGRCYDPPLSVKLLATVVSGAAGETATVTWLEPPGIASVPCPAASTGWRVPSSGVTRATMRYLAVVIHGLISMQETKLRRQATPVNRGLPLLSNWNFPHASSHFKSKYRSLTRLIYQLLSPKYHLSTCSLYQLILP